jgi:hypothetical protein
MQMQPSTMLQSISMEQWILTAPVWDVIQATRWMQGVQDLVMQQHGTSIQTHIISRAGQ